MIRAHTIRELTVDGGRSFISAGSGLVRTGDFMYVVADDERALGVFPGEGDAPGTLVPFLPGELPADAKQRKREKPDLEALALLEAESGEHPALLALESGSRPQRRGGVLWRLGERGELAGDPHRLDLVPLYESLEGEIPDLNIEGATVAGDRLLLFQRGNGRAGVNAVVSLDLATVRGGLARGSITEDAIVEIRRYDLGEIGGVRLCFSDATALPGGRVVFTAVAEGGEDTYRDGTCAGAAVGLLDRTGGPESWEPLDPPAKVEGVEVHGDGALLMVADGDDPTRPSPVLSAQLPRSFGSR